MTPAQADRVLRDTYCVSPARRRLALETRRGGPEGQERPAPRGHLSVHRHPLLPHPLRLLQLRVGQSVEKSLQADGAVSGRR